MELTRRRFFQALAASVVAAGVPLPIGMAALQASPVGGGLVRFDNVAALLRAMRRTRDMAAVGAFNRGFLS